MSASGRINALKKEFRGLIPLAAWRLRRRIKTPKRRLCMLIFLYLQSLDDS
jgi:hypothetical protein